MNELEFRAQAVLDHNENIAYALKEIKNETGSYNDSVPVLIALTEQQQVYLERLETALAESKNRKFFRRK